MGNLIETHISRVFIEGGDVFKTKKPVNLGFLDYSTPELRKQACLAEVALNSRLAPEIYLGVEPYRLPEGEMDWAVHMVRLPEEDRADRLLSRGALGMREIDRIAARVAEFHEKAQCDRKTSRYGSPLVIGYNLLENFEQIAALGQEAEIRELRAQQFAFLKKNTKLFRERIRAHRIRDGHGDLRLEQIYIGNSGKITILDCIEFNERFRFGDTCSDIAFLAMDLAFRGHRELSERLLAAYARESNDFDLFSLIGFYESYRATVRGKVSLFQNAPEQARAYFELARTFFRRPPRSPPLFVFSGIIGSGKSTLADWLGLQIGAPIAESDRTRKFFAGAAPTQPLRGPEFRDAYGRSATNRVYRELLRRGEVVLRSGRPAILDATFPTPKRRLRARELALRLRSPFRLIECRASPETCLKRLQAREGTQTVSDARAGLLNEFLRTYKTADELPSGEHLVLNTSRPLLQSQADLVAWILPRISPETLPMPISPMVLNTALKQTLSHPKTVHAQTRNSRITLTGYILARESEPLLARLRRLPGVTQIDNHLNQLTLERTRRGFRNRIEYEPESRADWPTPLRVSAGILGTFAILLGLRKRLWVRVPVPFFGLGLLLRALTNFDMARITGTFLRPTMRLERTIRISATIDYVFDFISRFENFSKFMSYVEDVQVDERGGLRWRVAGPGKIPIEWDATVGLFVRNHALSWKSLPGSPLMAEGQFILRAENSDTTRVDVSLSYHPPAGAFGFAVAQLLGFDPRKRIDEDLLLLRSLIEDEFKQLESSVPLSKSSRL